MTRNEYGFVVNLEQAATKDLGFFARASWQNNLTEIMQYTDIGWSLAGGGVLTGTRWGRPDDRFGAAAAVNGISRSYQAFLAAGGQGLIIGDGNLSYHPEWIVEAYYSIGLTHWAVLTLDYQFVADPGYNRARGPVSIGSARMHMQF